MYSPPSALRSAAIALAIAAPAAAQAPPPPSPEFQQWVAQVRARPRPASPAGPLVVADVRAGMEAATSVVAALPAGVRVTLVEAGDVHGEWIVPSEVDADRILLYLHGGGYVAGSPRSHRALAANIAHAARARALSVDYRLSPEHPPAAAVADAVAAYRWLVAEGFAPARIAVVGDSAGGGLALRMLMALRDGGDPLPAAGVTASAWTDLALTAPSLRTNRTRELVQTPDILRGMAALVCRDTNATSPAVSPLYADLRGLPPLLIQVGDAELLRDDSTRLAARARAAGVDVTLEVWPHMFHAWHLFADDFPEARAAIDAIGAFVRDRTG